MAREKVLRKTVVETECSIFVLEKVYYPDFQETAYLVMDLLGDFCEDYTTGEEAAVAFEEAVEAALNEESNN